MLSSFASGISERLVSGVYTVEDDELFKLLALLADSEDLFVEPSATAGFPGPAAVLQSGYPEEQGLDMAEAVHLVWATGGSLVPQADREQFYQKGKGLLL
jgi:D-serine dehydratase